MGLILISTRAEALRRRLEQADAPRTVLVLDLSADETWPSRVVISRPDPLAAADRFRILDDYISLISRLGERNRFSVAWLSHPVSEKNDLEPNPLFQQIVDYLAFRKFWDANGPGASVAILAPRKSLVTNVVSFAREQGIPCETPGLNWKPPSLLRNLRQFRKKIRTELRFSRRLKQYARQTQSFLREIEGSESVTLIRTWLDSRSRDAIEKGHDVFLGPLPAFLKKEGRQLLYYGGITDIDRQFEVILPDLRAICRAKVLPEVALLRRTDRWAILFFCMTIEWRIHIPESESIDGIGVSLVIRNYLRKRNPLTSLRKNYLAHRALRRLLQTISVEEAFTPFENNCWQKLLFRTLQGERPPIPVKAFQHAQIARNSARLFFGEEEREHMPMPTRILTLGTYTRNLLVKGKGYPAERTIAACALRQVRLPKASAKRPEQKRLLACLWTMRRSVDLMKFVMAAEMPHEGWRLRIRPHPVQPLDRVMKRLGRKVPESFEVSSGVFEEDLRDSGAVLYSGTTACLDALAAGLPVINVEFDDFISPDPLFEFEAFKWTIRSPEELEPTLKHIEGLSDEEFFHRRKEASAFVSRYFHPVTEDNLRLFLD